MTQPPRPRGRDPFGPPLDAGELRGWLRRLTALPEERQQAVVGGVNWHPLDAACEEALMGWLAHSLLTGAPTAQAFALKTLEKAPRVRRRRHLSRFRAIAAQADDDIVARLTSLFGPGLATGLTRRPPAPAPAAGEDDVAKLRAFFERSGKAR
ncbi:MAG: hypothetical protein VKQ33_03975 [Candidatus Sericytochromatia bacterium]|nr:hypothetical protein [Candidatus Sericytochromatia bacterium]